MKKLLLVVPFLLILNCCAMAEYEVFQTPIESATTEAVPSLNPVNPPATTASAEAPPSEAASAASPDASSEAVAMTTKKYPVASVEKINEYFEANGDLIKGFMVMVISGKPKLGMNPKMLELIYGEPLKKVQKQLKKAIVEAWVVENPNANTYTVIGLWNNKVVEIDFYSSTPDHEKVIKELSK